MVKLLVAEEKFDGVKGTRAVLQYATKNKYNMSAEEVQEHANRINTEIPYCNEQLFVPQA